MSFLPISNENIFFKTQGTRLGAIVAPNKGLEQALFSSYWPEVPHSYSGTLIMRSFKILNIFANMMR